MRALLPREPALRPTPSTEPARCLDARAPVGSTPFDVCHADPPRVVTAGRAVITIFPPTSDVPCRSQAPSAATMRRELVVRAALAIAPDYAVGVTTADSSKKRLAPPSEAPAPSPFDDVSEENLLARAALAPSR